MKPQTAKQLTDANQKALKEGKPVPYTKQQHAAAKGCDPDAKRYWNFFFKRQGSLHQKRICQYQRM